MTIPWLLVLLAVISVSGSGGRGRWQSGVGVQIENTWARCSQGYERPGSSVVMGSSILFTESSLNESLTKVNRVFESFESLESVTQKVHRNLYFREIHTSEMTEKDN